MLRSVGHVLEKTDAVSSSRLASNAKKWWISIKASKPEPTIFWEFTEKERNLVLKESEIRAGQSATVVIVGVRDRGLAAGQKSEPILLTEARPEVAYSYQK